MKKNIFLSIVSFACCCLLGSNNAIAFDSYPEGSYQIAKAVFLPDLSDSGFSNPKTSTVDNCSQYTLKSCPTGGLCRRCPFNSLLMKLESCDSEKAYKKSNNSCIKMTCSELNSSYKASVPSNQICTAFTEKTLNCYKNCRAVSCSGYTVSCTNKPTNATSVSKCPDCTSSTSNCSTNVCKVTACATNYKINSTATGCILKDDTCPSGYYKTCETGTQGSPKYTERGSACYQCKPKNTCNTSEYYKNTNGTYNVSSVQTSINLYGQSITTNIPAAGINVCFAGWTYPSGATVNGGTLTVNGDLIIGEHGGQMTTPITFNVPVVVNGGIKIFKNSTLTFKKGISGNYKCYSGYNTVISCPFSTSGKTTSSSSSSGGLVDQDVCVPKFVNGKWLQCAKY